MRYIPRVRAGVSVRGETVIAVLAIAFGGYVALVVTVESLVGVMGKRQAERGLQPGESWLVITTTGDDASTNNTVVAGVVSEGKLYVSANHWPRAWYRRALRNPDVEVERGGEKTPHRAVPVIAEEERARIARDYRLPLFLRFLTGFPPRSFLRLEPR
jgi:hypothetical protein